MEQISVIIGRTPVATTVSSQESFQGSCPSLSRTQRLIGFVTCFIIGYVISFGSVFALISGEDSGTRFGVTYSIGNIVALCASGFLVGPLQQVKLMLKPVRRVAAAIYLSLIVIVLIVAIAAPQLSGLVLLLVFIQFLAAIWYSASYIPFGRKIITGIMKKLCGSTSME